MITRIHHFSFCLFQPLLTQLSGYAASVHKVLDDRAVFNESYEVSTLSWAQLLSEYDSAFTQLTIADLLHS